MVCSMTRGPAKPMSAPGSPILRSPSMAKLAVTPPVVGSVSTEMYGSFSSSSRASAAETLASCMRLIVPSIMRAPPEQEMAMNGWRVSIASSMPRVTFSPTTAPIEPPMKPNSMEHITTGRPLRWPSAVMTASFMPSFFMASFRRAAYALVSTNLSGSVEVMPASCSVQRPSRSISRRCLEFILKWNWHLGQTKRFPSRSLRKTMVRQDSHLTHRPSVRTRRSSGGVDCSIDFLSRLNQAMEESCQFSVISFQLNTEKQDCTGCRVRLFELLPLNFQLLVVDPPLSQYTLGVGVFHLAHLGDEVGELDELGMSVAAGADDVDALGAVLQGLGDFVGVKHFVADRVVDFIEDDKVVLAAVDGVAAGFPAFLRQLDVRRVGFSAADFDEAAAHGANFKFVVTKHLGGVELAIVPGTLDELDHQHSQALAHGAKGGAERAGGLALARSGINDEESFFFRHNLAAR